MRDEKGRWLCGGEVKEEGGGGGEAEGGGG